MSVIAACGSFPEGTVSTLFPLLQVTWIIGTDVFLLFRVVFNCTSEHDVFICTKTVCQSIVEYRVAKPDPHTSNTSHLVPVFLHLSRMCLHSSLICQQCMATACHSLPGPVFRPLPLSGVPCIPCPSLYFCIFVSFCTLHLQQIKAEHLSKVAFPGLLP